MNKHASAMGKLSQQKRTKEERQARARYCTKVREQRNKENKEKALKHDEHLLLIDYCMPNWERFYKSKNDALVAIMDALVMNPAVAGDDGLLRFHIAGEWLTIKPRKKKEAGI